MTIIVTIKMFIAGIQSYWECMLNSTHALNGKMIASTDQKPITNKYNVVNVRETFAGNSAINIKKQKICVFSSLFCLLICFVHLNNGGLFSLVVFIVLVEWYEAC